MPMRNVGELSVKLTADHAQFDKGMRNAEATLTRYTQSIKSLAGSVGKTAIAITGATAGLGVAVKATLDNIDEMTRRAGNLSIPVKQFQQLSYAAKLTGTDMDQLADVIKDISVRVQDAAFSNGGPLVDFFNQINQKASDWAKLTPDQQFARFIKEINKMPSNQARFWLDEINDSAAEMFSTLYGNADQFQALQKEAADAGVAINTNMTQNVKAARMEFDRMLTLGTASWQNMVAAASPAVSYVIKGINQWILGAAKARGGFGQLGVTLATSVINGAQQATQAFANMVNTIIDAAHQVGDSLGIDVLQVAHAKAYREEINHLHELQDELQKTKGIMHGDMNAEVPGWIELPPEAKKQYDDMQARIETLYKRLSGHIDVSGVTQGLEQIKQKIKEAASEGGEGEGITIPVTPKIQSKDLNTKLNLGVDTSHTQKSIDSAWQSVKSSLATQQEKVQETYAKQITAMERYYSLHKDKADEAKDYEIKIAQERDKALADLNKQRVKEHGTFWEKLKLQVADTSNNFDAMWGNAFQNFTQGVGDSVAQAVMEQQSLSDGMRSVLRGVIQSTISALVQIGAQKLALWAIDKMINTGTQASYAGTVMAQSQAQAFLAAENAFASTAAIPVIGPALAPGAAATALAAAQGFASAATTAAASGVAAGMAHSGMDYIPREGTWLLDKGERVYTNQSARQIDDMYRTVKQPRKGQQPQMVNYQISTVDAKGFEKMLKRNKRALNRQNRRLANDRGKRLYED